jgi:sec-independent protein translocase protein TatB
MFDVAFSELLVIGVVALVVIGPERLPKVARTAGAWLGRLNRYVAQVKQDIDRDMQLEELRKLQAQMKETAQKYEVIAAETGQELKREVDQVERVMQAMSATDGGLAMQEYEKIKAEQAAALPETTTDDTANAAPDSTAAAPVEPAPDSASAETEPKSESAQVQVQAQTEDFRSGLDEEVVADDMNTSEHKQQSRQNA